MMSPELKHKIVKIALGAAVATFIGYTIKMEKKLQDKLDENYESNHG